MRAGGWIERQKLNGIHALRVILQYWPLSLSNGVLLVFKNYYYSLCAYLRLGFSNGRIHVCACNSSLSNNAILVGTYCCLCTRIALHPNQLVCLSIVQSTPNKEATTVNSRTRTNSIAAKRSSRSNAVLLGNAESSIWLFPSLSCPHSFPAFTLWFRWTILFTALVFRYYVWLFTLVSLLSKRAHISSLTARHRRCVI